MTTVQEEAIVHKNTRAYTDLIACMPVKGNWLIVIADAMTSLFPSGYRATAFDVLLEEILEEVDGQQEELKDEFESQEKICYDVSPREHMNQLITIQDKLKTQHGVDKGDRNILDQMFKVLRS